MADPKILDTASDTNQQRKPTYDLFSSLRANRSKKQRKRFSSSKIEAAKMTVVE